jgi:hypothetical protein
VPDATQEFLNSPIVFLHRTPCECTAEFIGLRTMNLQVIREEDFNFAQLRPTPQGEAGALFYILGWKGNQSSTGVLGSAARFFFTGPLSGCTFAVDKNWTTPRVIHVNYTLPTGAMDTGRMTGTVNTYMANATSWLRFWQTGPNITVVQSHNRPEGYTYNIFGYRSRVGWSFFQQRIETVGLGDQRVRGVDELDTWV